MGGFREPDRAVFQHQPVECDDALRERLGDLLSPTPVSRDELVRRPGSRPPPFSPRLVELAVAGRAELLPGGMVSLS